MFKKDNIIHKIVTLATAKYPDSEIYLYGSRARGDSNRLSDWDLLLVLLNSASGQVFSPLIYSKTEWEQNHTLTPLYESIQKVGIRIK